MQNVRESALWQKFEARARGRHGMWWLAGISFLEPIFLPIFPETSVIAMTFVRREQWLRFALVATGCAFLGATVAFWFGHLLFRLFGPQILAAWGLRRGFRMARELLGRNPLLVTLLVAVTPVPDKLFIIPAGFFHVPYLPFVLGFVIRRFFWFGLSGYLAQRFGERALFILKRWFEWVVVVAGFALLYGVLHFFHVFGL